MVHIMASIAGRRAICAAAAAPARARSQAPQRGVAFRHFFLDKASCFRIQERILLESRGTLLETIPEAEQERCPGWGS